MLPLRRTRRQQRAAPFTLSAPIGGLNGRDALANMPPGDAFVLDNLFPSATSVRTRKGSANHVTGVGSTVETLAVYQGGSSSKLLAFAGGSVYDASVAGAVGAAIASGKSSNQPVTTMFSNLGSRYLIGVTGADAPFNYNGAAFAVVPAITGVTGTPNNLHTVAVFKGRLFFGALNELGFYYLAVGAIGGAASYFDLSQIAKSGGYVQAIGTFSADSGSGPADYVVFITTAGEYIVYSGTDPAVAANFTLVGRYYAPPPIGRKAVFNFKSDLYIITATGVLPFSVIRQEGAVNEGLKALSSKLGRAYTDLTEFSTVNGWQGVSYPRTNMLVINVPASTTLNTSYQFVMNTETNAWCRFTGLDAKCFAVFDDRLYFGNASGNVVLADEGYDDNGSDILCDGRQAYNYFDDGRGSGFADKQFHFATFVVRTAVQPPISAELNVNFEDDNPDYVGSTTLLGADWDTATWDVDDWAGATRTQNVTVPFGKLGYAASLWLRLQMADSDLEWYATRIVFERATGVGTLT